MDHRRTPSKKAVVLPGWALVSSIAACVLGVVVLAVVLVMGGSGSGTPSAAATHTTAPSTPAGTPTHTPSSTQPTQPPQTTEPVAVRTYPVAVFNNTGTTGLAAREAGTVRAKGWTVVRIGNWRGLIPANTVYYPHGHAAEAKLLASDVGVSRLRPSEPTMQQDRLTLILSGPQQ